jgi:hypothetical protein
MNDPFAYIAGRTSGGAPYGITWEKMGNVEMGISNEKEERESETNGEGSVRAKRKIVVLPSKRSAARMRNRYSKDGYPKPSARAYKKYPQPRPGID